MELLLGERAGAGLDWCWDTIERMFSASRAVRIRAVDCAKMLAAVALATQLAGGPMGVGQTPGAGQSAVAATPAARFVVVIDAAHGGDDSGAQLGGSVAEKTVTLAMSVRLRSLLTARGFQVVTTREGNLTLEPDARAQIANRAGAGLGAAACLSLHATEAGTGVHIFVSSLAPSAATRFLAWKTAQSAYVTRSLQLSGVIGSAFERGSDAGPIAANPARTSLPGVDSMACPAVALEIAPVRDSDGQIETEVTDAEYQSRIVDALAAAMLDWRTNWAGSSRPASSQAPQLSQPEPAPKAAPKATGAATGAGNGAGNGAGKPVRTAPKAAPPTTQAAPKAVVVPKAAGGAKQR